MAHTEQRELRYFMLPHHLVCVVMWHLTTSYASSLLEVMSGFASLFISAEQALAMSQTQVLSQTTDWEGEKRFVASK